MYQFQIIYIYIYISNFSEIKFKNFITYPPNSDPISIFVYKNGKHNFPGLSRIQFLLLVVPPASRLDLLGHLDFRISNVNLFDSLFSIKMVREENLISLVEFKIITPRTPPPFKI